MVKDLTSQLDIPICAKIRLGWYHRNKNHLDIARTIENQGCALIAVHARTRDQGFEGNADWDAIAEIKEAVHIHVIGNGDVKPVEDIQKNANPYWMRCRHDRSPCKGKSMDLPSA